MIHTNLMHRQRSRRGTKIPHNAAIDPRLNQSDDVATPYVMDCDHLLFDPDVGPFRVSPATPHTLPMHLAGSASRTIGRQQKPTHGRRKGRSVLSTGFVKCSYPTEQCRMKEPSPLTTSTAMARSTEPPSVIFVQILVGAGDWIEWNVCTVNSLDDAGEPSSRCESMHTCMCDVEGDMLYR
jgi:hypothetical protein